MKRVLVIIVTCITTVIAILVFIQLFPRQLVFYYNFPWRAVRTEYKDFARALYNTNEGTITQIQVADDSRSGQCIRWIIISNERLAKDKEDLILDDLLEFMQKRTAATTPLVWEIFFCSEKVVNSTYVSRYGYDRIINDDDYFRDWESVQNVENILSYDTLTKQLMKSCITRPMYDLDPRPIIEMTPNLPTHG